MGIAPSQPINNEITGTIEEMQEEQDIPMVKANIKHVVLFSVDKTSLHIESNDLLQLNIDCAVPGIIKLYNNSKYTINDGIDTIVMNENDRINESTSDSENKQRLERSSYTELIKEIEVDEGMTQHVSLEGIENKNRLMITVERRKTVDLPKTNFIVIDNITVFISVINGTAHVIQQNFMINENDYCFYDIFGIGKTNGSVSNGLGDDNACVICTSDPKEILLLPCRHVALCKGCYDELKHRSRQCPICRRRLFFL